MTLNSVMAIILAIILHYFTEFGSFGGQLRRSGWRYIFTVCNNNVIQKIWLLAIWLVAIFAEITENECIMYRHLRDIDPFCDPLRSLAMLSTWPIWLRAEVSKQIRVRPSVLISPQSTIVLEKPWNHPSCTNYQSYREWDDFSLIANYLLWTIA